MTATLKGDKEMEEFVSDERWTERDKPVVSQLMMTKGECLCKFSFIGSVV